MPTYKVLNIRITDHFSENRQIFIFDTVIIMLVLF